jgi:MFS family permease
MIRTIAKSYRDAYAGLPRAAWMLAAVDFVNSSGTMVLFFMTLYLTQKLNYSLAIAGRTLGAYGLGSIAGAVLGGWLCDRLGARNVQGMSLLLMGTILILLGFFISLPAIVALMALLGVFSTSLFPATSTAMSQACPRNLLTRGFSLGRLARNLGVTIGPVLGGFLAVLDYRYLFWADGLTSLAAAALFFHFFRSNQTRPRVSTSAGQTPWKDFRFLFVILQVFLMGVVFYQIFSTLPVYLHRVYGFRENRIGQLLAVNTLMIVLFEMVLIHRLQKHHYLRVAAFGAVCLGGGFALMPAGRGFLFAALTVAIWTVGEMLTIPSLSAFVAVRGGEKHQGKYQGMFSMAFAFSAMLGPVAGTKAYERFGPACLWLGAGVIGIILAVGFLWIDHKGRIP